MGHGGSGVYERLTVLGIKALEMMGTVYISEKFSTIGIPFEIQQHIPAAILRQIWTRKRVERLCSNRSLYLFGKSHLATAQVW